MQNVSKNQEDNGRDKRWKNKISMFLINYFNLLILTLAFIILSCGFFFLVWPKYRASASNIVLKSKSLEDETAAQLDYFNRLTNLRTAYQKISEPLKARLDVFLPDSHQAEDLISQAESIIVKSGLILSSLTVEVEDAEAAVNASVGSSGNQSQSADRGWQSFGKVNITMQIVGADYQALKNLLRTLENNLRLMDITKLSYNPDSNTLSLNLVTYYLR